MGFFDVFKEDPEKKAERERIKDEQLEYQKEILMRRGDPKKMAAYEAEIDKRRQTLAQERAVYNFQKENAEGKDLIDEWKQLKDDGKIKMGRDLERDASTSRLGSEGLLNVRVDERMPYIDQGYVEEDTKELDLMSGVTGWINKKVDSSTLSFLRLLGPWELPSQL
jgi:hypothetical protein